MGSQAYYEVITMEGPMNKHQNLAQHNDPYADVRSGGGTGDTRPNDAHAPQAGEGHVHTTEPSKEAPHHHGSHGHESVHHHHGGHSGGHKRVHEHFPDGHSGGHKHHKY